MTDAFDSAIQEIAIKHGVVLSKDDPILILQTMNERLLEDTKQAQAAMLAQFREEIEHISSQWKYDAKEKAEKVLNVALATSKESIVKLLHDSSNESLEAMRKLISDSLIEARSLTEQAQKFSLYALFSWAGLLIVSLLVIFLFHK